MKVSISVNIVLLALLILLLASFTSLAKPAKSSYTEFYTDYVCITAQGFYPYPGVCFAHAS